MYLLIDRTSGRVFASGKSIGAFLDSLSLFRHKIYFEDCLPNYYFRAYNALIALEAESASWDIIRDITNSVSPNFVLLHVEIGG